MLTGCPVAGKKKSVDLVNAFIAGAPRSAEGIVFYGVDEYNVKRWQLAQRGAFGPWYYIDNSYFDKARGLQFRVTRNRIQHDGGGASDGRRFVSLGIPIEAWRQYLGFDLVIQQSDQFMRYVIGAPYEVREPQRAALLDNTLVRRWSNNKPEQQASLRHDLLGARVVLTHSSAAAVQAILAGVRVVVSDVSAAHRYTDMATPDDEERHRWASVLADNQWTLDEFRSGLAWRMLHAQG